MKCSKCGAEIDAGSVFCKKCGEPVQMVPDYNILEDDFLISLPLLEEKKNQPEKRKKISRRQLDKMSSRIRRLPPVARVLLPLKRQ